jgi:hypothetical protein
MTCPADRTRADEPPGRARTELDLATDQLELWVPELRVVSDSPDTSDFFCRTVVVVGAFRQQNTREQVIEGPSFSIRLCSIRKPPFSHV